MDADFALLSEQFEDVFLSNHDINLRTPFRLLDLPPELWIKVCEFAVAKAQPIKVGKEPSLQDQVAITRQPAITRTCRLLRYEALPLFYSLNSFEMFHNFSVPCPRKWIHALGTSNLRRIKSFHMVSSCDLGFWEGSYRRASISVNIEYLGSEPDPTGLFAGHNRFRISFE